MEEQEKLNADSAPLLEDIRKSTDELTDANKRLSEVYRTWNKKMRQYTLVLKIVIGALVFVALINITIFIIQYKDRQQQHAPVTVPSKTVMR